MTDRDLPAHVKKKRFTRVGDTIKADENGEQPPGGRIIHADPAQLRIKAHPATITFTSSGTLQAATTSAQQMFAIVVPERGDLTHPTKELINAAKKMDEAVVKTAMASETMTFADIGLGTGVLTDRETHIALETYFEIKARRLGFWQGVLVAAVPSLLLGVAALIKLFD